ncbi:MAG: hypothetical protein V4539_14820 [Bacteroidota bacterium]
MKKIYSCIDKNFMTATLLSLPALYFFVSAILNIKAEGIYPWSEILNYFFVHTL